MNLDCDLFIVTFSTDINLGANQLAFMLLYITMAAWIVLLGAEVSAYPSIR
jgi:hypothetical protein